MTEHYSVVTCLNTLRTWTLLLEASQNDDSVTAGKFTQLLKSYEYEMITLFNQSTWDDQIHLAVGSQLNIWVSMLDTEQRAAYQIMKD